MEITMVVLISMNKGVLTLVSSIQSKKISRRARVGCACKKVKVDVKAIEKTPKSSPYSQNFRLIPGYSRTALTANLSPSKTTFF